MIELKKLFGYAYKSHSDSIKTNHCQFLFYSNTICCHTIWHRLNENPGWTTFWNTELKRLNKPKRKKADNHVLFFLISI